MTKKKSILVTKLLSSEQKMKLANFDLIEQELIQITINDQFKLDHVSDFVVFSSKNAVKALEKGGLIGALKGVKVYCVGEKTAEFLKQLDINAEFVAENAFDLANFLILEKPKKITFFCGNLRRNELPALLKENEILVDEQVVYQTDLLKPKFIQKFDGILFFSPSGVRSFCQKNKPEAIAFCLGNTTAITATDFFEEVFVAEEQSVDGLINTLNETYGYA
ncbi:uroporphyrinogen-III synthase [Namhaeicola litoreus]|uniref:Uroporphyrinogen-III synthase n=1 Tax=Namhaeicola litoreus TaxID=1052145 RepID=A0ABW3Y3H6_9FLAO